ncbi:MAG: phosphoribosylamine--glycine ligase [Spirochaeta sp.]
MNVLVMGNGGREHALVWALARSKSVGKIFAYPGNAGTADAAENIPAPLADPEWETLISACRKHRIDWVFVGPEQPLTDGVVDALAAAGVPAFGPHEQAAQLEGSKSFSKDFMLRNGIPTAAAATVHTMDQLEAELEKRPGMVVLKKSGLAAGKGVLESADREELRAFAEAVLRSDTIVVEDYLNGFEVSLFTLSNGQDYLLLPPCADYKKAGDGNTGPNTGGMGSITPVPWFSDKDLQTSIQTIIQPTHDALRKEGLAYAGVLYFGLMITGDGPKLLEYNVRFGDPETQILLPLLDGDFGSMCKSLLDGALPEIQLAYNAAVTVVAAAPGYPGEYPRHLPARITPGRQDNGMIYHASTLFSEDRTVLTNGGRCFTATGWGDTLEQARATAYQQLEGLEFRGMQYRSDIGLRVLQSSR